MLKITILYDNFQIVSLDMFKAITNFLTGGCIKCYLSKIECHTNP